jgi:hypothetical protein
MNITSATTVESDSPQPATGRWQVASLVEAPPLRFFRRVVRLRFETGGMADRLSIDAKTTTLKAVFQPYDYDALNPGEPSLKALLSASDEAVIVTLDAPRQVKQVRLSPGSVPGPGSPVELYRLDGEALADEPTVTAKVQGVDLAEESFVVGRKKALERSFGARMATLPADADFTDTRFAIRLGGSADRSLRVDDLVGVQIRGYPAGPRLGISDPNEPDSATFFWQVPGEIGKTPPDERGNVDAGGAFAKALEGYLDDFFARSAASSADGHPPRFVDVALVMASDAPCTLNITAFDITYHLVRQSFPSHEEKQVLRFPGERVTAQEVSVQLPGEITVTSATLETVESFRRDRPLSFDDGHDVPDATPTQKEGVHVGVERWIAQGITPPQAMSVSGIAIALMSISNNTELLVALQEDWHGQPSGKRLATGEITLDRIGQRGWATLLFPDAITLPSSLCWILVKAANGRAVWLVDAGSTPARMLERSNDANVWAELSGFKGLQALHRLYSRSKQAREQHPTSLTVGTHAAAAMSEQNGTKAYDLASTFNDYLSSSPSSTPATTIPLTFTSALPGLVTIYPPTIEYDLVPQP